MEKNTILIAAIALLAGFIGGFLLANNMNRAEMTALRSGTSRPAGNANTATQANNDTLSPEEIRAKVAEADASPDNFAFQKKPRHRTLSLRCDEAGPRRARTSGSNPCASKRAGRKGF